MSLEKVQRGVDMNWKYIIPVLLCVVSCSGPAQMIPEPVDAGNLVLGAVILNIDGYQDTFLTLEDGIEVAVVGRYFDNGVEKRFGQWTRTDEFGYFVIPNVPDGEYALKGIIVNQIGLGELRIANELIDVRENYYELNVYDRINLSAEIFDTRSVNRIIDFKYNVFTIYANEIVDHKRYDALRDLKLTTGGEISSPPLPVWFIENYPESGWVDFLNLYY